MRTHFLLFFLVVFSISDIKAQDTFKINLFEQFTSTSCPTCGNRNPEFYNEILHPYEDKVIHVAYHNQLPLPIDTFYKDNIPENRGRSDYYNIRNSPSLVLNGKVLAPARPLYKGSDLPTILQQTSPLKLTVSHYKHDGSFNVEVNAELLQNLPNTNYKLYIAVVEKEILYCTYFEYVFDNVFRAFVEEGNGVDFNLKEAGSIENYVKKISINENWEYSMLYAIAFVQNTETKEIVNAGTSKIVDKGEASRFNNDAFKLTSRVYHSRCGSQTGSVFLGVCVDAAPIEFPENVTYKWSSGDTTQNLIDIPPGNYTVEIKDNKYNTSIEQTFEIKPSVGIEVEEIIMSANAANLLGSANVIVNGGNDGFTIAWDDGNDSFSRNDLSKGVYNYLITDSEGCQKENAVAIERDFTSNDVVINLEEVSCNGKQDGSVNIDLLSSATGDVVLIFKEDVLVQNPSQLSVGSYIFKVIDSFNDVLLEDAFEITEPEMLATEILMNNENQLVANVIGGTPPYTFLWNNGATTEIIENPITNNYNLTVSDANECLSMASLTFTNLELYENQAEKIKIFPNPVKVGEDVSILSSYKIKFVKIYGADGSLVNDSFYTDNGNKIELQQLNAGIYILEVVLFDMTGEFVKLLIE